MIGIQRCLEMKKKLVTMLISIGLIGAMCIQTAGCSVQENNYIINVSYDPTREFYEQYNELFVKHWEDVSGQTIDIIQSHGGSGKQALEVANGLEADVVTLALEQDINQIRNAGLIEPGFVDEFPDESSPYTSAIVFLVRRDNPKQIHDWPDLLREDVDVITPNPKTSGGARWNYLAAWYYFEKQGQSEAEILASMKQLFENVLVLDSGARASTTTFVENRQGDVLLSWENEAFLSMQEHPGEYEIVIPSASILCQPTVAVVDEMVQKHGTKEVAEEYLNYLYSEEAQQLIAESFYRPADEDIYEAYTSETAERTISGPPENGRWIVSDIDLTDISHFGGWEKATEVHFKDNGYFDNIYN